LVPNNTTPVPTVPAAAAVDTIVKLPVAAAVDSVAYPDPTVRLIVDARPSLNVAVVYIPDEYTV
jgi:hypothetical protein